MVNRFPEINPCEARIYVRALKTRFRGAVNAEFAMTALRCFAAHGCCRGVTTLLRLLPGPLQAFAFSRSHPTG
jgi:hypothetical protein